jgi:ubiquinone/menaquinone biosynthesis C-methylase UbiE
MYTGQFFNVATAPHKATTGVDWTEYATAYDLFVTHNPPYRQLLQTVEAEFKSWSVPPGGCLMDLGAGTGNFSIPLAKAFPHATVLHVEPDRGMIALAEKKARSLGLRNISFIRSVAEDLCIEPESLSGAVSIHALYTMPQPQQRLSDVARWLAPGARAALCDLGRVMSVGDWSFYFAKHWIGTYGIAETMRIFKNNRPLAKANKHIRVEQLANRYWVHDHNEFVHAVECAGMQVRSHHKAYRDYSDFVACVK